VPKCSILSYAENQTVSHLSESNSVVSSTHNNEVNVLGLNVAEYKYIYVQETSVLS